jgi:hypothetical protein
LRVSVALLPAGLISPMVHFLSVVTSPDSPERRSYARARVRAREHLTDLTCAGQRASDAARPGGGKTH